MDLDWFSDSSWLADRTLLRNAIASLVLLIVILTLRVALLRRVKTSDWADADTKLRWRSQVRHATLAVLALGLFLIWGSELRTLALSLVAVAVALVVATKELILCVMGAILRASTSSYSVGGRIELAGLHGDVIATGVLTTTILETGPAHQRTGRSLIVPNSLLLASPVINETFSGERVLLHVVKVPVALDHNWKRAEAALLDAATSVTAEFAEEVRSSLTAVAESHRLDPVESRRSAGPQVFVGLPEAGKLELSVRVPTPVRAKGEIEQRILRRYLELVSGEGSSTRA